jgi:hypothetical protein
MAEYGYCQCGCGERTKTYRSSDRTRGLVAGEPRRYLRGHNNRRTLVHNTPEPKKVHVNKISHTLTRCAGTKPDGAPCDRVVRPDRGYCLLHDPYRTMLRKGKAADRSWETERLVQQVRDEQEAGAEALIGEGA